MYASSRCVPSAPTHRPAPSRPVVVWCAVTVGAAVVTMVAGPVAEAAVAQVGAGEALVFDRVLVSGCAAAALVAAGWLWLVTTEVVVGLLTGRARRGRRSQAGTVRGLVLAACGVAALAGTATAAAATPTQVVAFPATDDPGPDDPRSDRRLLRGLPLPDRATGPAPGPDRRETGRAAPGERTEPRPSAGPPPPARQPEESPPSPESAGPGTRPPADRPYRADHRVGPGDCLWTIAERHLGSGATPAEITAYWRRIHVLNAAVIGPDPDLVHPGQVLRLPPLP